MKNINILKSKEPSRLLTINNSLTSTNQPDFFSKSYMDLHKYVWQNIYITNDDKINANDWYYNSLYDEITKYEPNEGDLPLYFDIRQRKIILTNDLELIKDGIQSIDDSFLEWFVKNPTCEYVDIKEVCCGMFSGNPCDTCTLKEYKIITPVDYYDTMLKMVMIPKEYFGSDDEMMEVPMPISKEPKKIYTEQDMLLAAKYGYNFHKTTSFPEQEFDDSCVRNTQQWLTTLKCK